MLACLAARRIRGMSGSAFVPSDYCPIQNITYSFKIHLELFLLHLRSCYMKIISFLFSNVGGPSGIIILSELMILGEIIILFIRWTTFESVDKVTQRPRHSAAYPTLSMLPLCWL